MEKIKKKIIICSIFPLFSLIFILYSFFNPNFLKGNNINEYSNDYCFLNISNLICKNKYKKNKFIWIFLDGNAYDQLVLLSNKTKYGIPIIFRGKGKGYKHTSPLFSQMFSGVPSHSMFYSELETDHIFKQLYNANYTINFLGMDEPVNKLCGKDNKIFQKKHILKKHEKYSFYEFCHVLYPIDDSWSQNYFKSIVDRDQRLSKGITKEKVYSDLDYHFKMENKDILQSLNLNDCFNKSFFGFNENESLVYYNTEIDSNNHFFTKEHIKTISEEYNTENWLIKIMKWIDEHPDYALIVNSDHGGQKFYGEDELNNHGFDIEGNEAILFIYTKDFKDNYNKLQSDNIFYTKLDPSSIISQILENINIPLQSEGISFPIGNDSLLRYTAYKSKEIQLINKLKAYSNKYPKFEQNLKEIMYKITNSEFYGIKEEEYEKYFDNNFTNRGINFLKDIQVDIIKTLNNKNKFSNIILSLIFIIIYISFIIYQIRNLFQIIKEEEKNILNLFLFIIFISLFLIQFLKYLLFNQSIYNRLLFGIFSSPFCLIICNILIKFFYSQENNMKINILLLLIGLISIVFHFFKLFVLLKKYFSTIIKSRILKTFLHPILFLELNYTTKKNFLKYNIFLFKISLFNIIKVIYIILIILIFAFDMSTDNYFISHTPFNYFITISIYILLITLFILGEYIILSNVENKSNNRNQEVFKNIFFLFEYFINDESNRLMILMIYILFEYFFDHLYNKNLKKIYKIIISITIININEIFYLLTSRVYALETSKIIFSRTIFYHIDSGSIFNKFLELSFKIRFPVILIGFLLETNLFENQLFNNDETFLLKIILNIKCCFNFIFFSYEFILLKNIEDFFTITVYSFVDLSIFLLDFFNNGLIYLNLSIVKCFIKRKKFSRLQVIT